MTYYELGELAAYSAADVHEARFLTDERIMVVAYGVVTEDDDAVKWPEWKLLPDENREEFLQGYRAALKEIVGSPDES